MTVRDIAFNIDGSCFLTLDWNLALIAAGSGSLTFFGVRLVLQKVKKDSEYVNLNLDIKLKSNTEKMGLQIEGDAVGTDQTQDLLPG